MLLVPEKKKKKRGFGARGIFPRTAFLVGNSQRQDLVGSIQEARQMEQPQQSSLRNQWLLISKTIYTF